MQDWKYGESESQIWFTWNKVTQRCYNLKLTVYLLANKLTVLFVSALETQAPCCYCGCFFLPSSAFLLIPLSRRILNLLLVSASLTANWKSNTMCRTASIPVNYFFCALTDLRWKIEPWKLRWSTLCCHLMNVFGIFVSAEYLSRVSNADTVHFHQFIALVE